MARAPRDDGAHNRLNQPGRARRSIVPRVRVRQDTFGQFAESFARFMGTAKFLTYMTIFVLVWLVWNAPVGPERPRFDIYPFIFLTLMLSLQASYAAPLILLAQNRQEARDRLQLQDDRSGAAQSRADMDFLAREIASIRMSVGELATRDYLRSEIRNELRSLLSEMDDSDGDPDRAPSRRGGSRDGG
ncbi:MAG: DUF1003 domain-containing protein [Propionibacteriaceae bacterium]